MKTKRIIWGLLASTVLTGSLLTSCKEDEATLPPIGGYNSADEVASTNLVAYWGLNNDPKESKSGVSPEKTENASYTTGIKGQALSLNNGYLRYPTIAGLNSANDNGADLVETSYLMQGLLTARQYFDNNTAEETALRKTINELWNAVEWDWHTKGGEKVLYWHWSPTFEWKMNLKIQGWNECLITYFLAAASSTHSISKDVYTNGWAQNGAMKNGKQFYGVTLPLGFDLGGPLFFSHYSFLELNPKGLKDQYADYWQQNLAHTQINYKYCLANPKNYVGYGPNCWGLTASDSNNGYAAHSPTEDLGVISPTAALSAMPYLPQESMQALRFFYYKMGDKLWKEYGFVDAFNLTNSWFANSFLAIDQGPIICMIENHRTGLLWKLFMSCPEGQAGKTKLGFE